MHTLRTCKGFVMKFVVAFSEFHIRINKKVFSTRLSRSGNEAKVLAGASLMKCCYLLNKCNTGAVESNRTNFACTK